MSARPTGRIEIRFDSEASAKTVARSLAADDDRFARTERRGATIVLRIETDDVPSLRRAVDDVLASLGVSEDVLEMGDIAE